MTIPKRHPLQIGRSSYRTEPSNGAWWVVESFDVMGWQRTRDDREEWIGPFDSEGTAMHKLCKLVLKDREAGR